jgi:hypothetical protein
MQGQQRSLNLQIILILLLTSLFFTQQSQKDIENFLEYIRQILQKFQKMQENRQKKLSQEERKKIKKKIKKHILNKLANPFYYYLKRQHTIIKTEKPKADTRQPPK